MSTDSPYAWERELHEKVSSLVDANRAANAIIAQQADEMAAIERVREQLRSEIQQWSERETALRAQLSAAEGLLGRIRTALDTEEDGDVLRDASNARRAELREIAILHVPLPEGASLEDRLTEALMVSAKRFDLMAEQADLLGRISDALQTDEDSEGLVEVARAACRAEHELAQLERHRDEADDADDAARNAAGL